VTAGQTASFSVAASGTPAPTVQWQLSTDGGAQWTTIPGATETTYTTPATTGAQNGDQYRAVFTNAAGTADSNAATLTVTIPPPPAPPVTTTTTTTPATSGGYHLVAANGSVYSYGGAPFYGSMGGQTLNKPIVGTATTPGDGGYWLVASDGGIFSFGNAGFHGTVAGTTSASIVSLVPTADGGGYWETASSGQVFQFGDATSAGTALTQTATIVAMSD
jgi:hypothetical protein